jgi:hypothetical protein
MSLAEASEALDYISPDGDHLEWWRIICAIKAEFGEEGRDLAENWSQGSDKYDRSNFNSTWRSTQPRGIGIGTLYRAAINSGYVPSKSSNDSVWRSKPKIKPKPPEFTPIAYHSTPAQPEGLELWTRSVRNITAIYAHSYSQAKGIPLYHYSAAIADYHGTSSIVVPMYSFPRWEVCGVQVITGKRDEHGKWVKRTLGPTGVGCVGYHKGAPIVVVEGWADGVTTFELMNGKATVLIAFGKPDSLANKLDLYWKNKRCINVIKDAK